MVHSNSGWTRGVQVKLWDPLRTHAIPERLRGAFTMRRYINPRLPLPLPNEPYKLQFYRQKNTGNTWDKQTDGCSWANMSCRPTQ